ncbi:hypothetical protein DFP72DRAFT_894811 [Ephemerocybe angulata]|uniref:Uncharacterized protein n=1 Tax=Ephemerocybe angulata TaxID=980116 RepID=A0A8H6HZL3_9AGAR|nr:hypothetical protein DFP72DRAFT_894811 [Tulosesus angulatus]
MNPFEIAGDVVASQDLRSSEFEVQQVTSSPASRLSAGGFTDTWNDCSHLSSFCSSGVIQARSENRTLEGERNALSQATAAQTQEVEKEKGTAERLRGGGVEGEDSKEGRNFRRFSFTAPPEHAPPYQRPHPADYPTEERPSGSFVGVGSLPGKNEEAGVALVPDELPEAKKERPYVVLPSGFASGMPLKKGKGHTVRKASGTSLKSQLPTKEKPEARGMSVLEMIHVHFEEGDHHVIPKIDMPSKEELSGSYCGVGSLPGKRREPAVALFPVERKHHLDNEVDVSQLLPSMETPSISYGGVGSLPGKKDEAGVALLPEERRHAEVEILAPPVPRIPAGHKKIPRTPSGAHRHVGAEPAAHGHHASHKERVAEAHAKAVESRHWAGMGNQPHGAAKLRYVGMRTTLTGEEMYQAKFASGIDNRSMAKVDLPSTEEPSLSRCGVGSLPGKTGEEGVAIFPYERPRHMDNEIAVEEFMPTTEVITISYGGVGSLPGKRSEQRVALTPEERLHPEGTAKVELPSTEEPSLSRCGVGSLPGKTGEEGVAIFPYERPRHMDNVSFCSHSRTLLFSWHPDVAPTTAGGPASEHRAPQWESRWRRQPARAAE